MQKFLQKWTVEHHCETPGCGTCIVIDAGKYIPSVLNTSDIYKKVVIKKYIQKSIDCPVKLKNHY